MLENYREEAARAAPVQVRTRAIIHMQILTEVVLILMAVLWTLTGLMLGWGAAKGYFKWEAAACERMHRVLLRVSNRGPLRRIDNLSKVSREWFYLARGSGGNPFFKARGWLRELSSMVSHEIERHPRGEPTYGDCYDPQDLETKLLYGEVYPIQLGNGSQRLWVRVAAARSSRGYRPIEVIEEPPPTHAAIIAALTALEVREVNTGMLHRLSPVLAADRDGEDTTEACKSLVHNEGRKQVLQDLDEYQRQPLGYAESLLQFYRPGFTDLPGKEQCALIERTYGYTNEFLSALHKLLRFLEYGTPGRDLRLSVENAARDVRAVVLADVEGLSHVAIGEELGIKRSKSDIRQGGHSRVGKMVRRGRSILEQAWGREGWKKQIASLRVEAAQPGRESDAVEESERVRQRIERLDREEPSVSEIARPIDLAVLDLSHLHSVGSDQEN